MVSLSTSWVVLIFVHVIARTHGAIEFTKQPRTTVVIEGKPAKLECAVSPSDDIEYYWTLNGAQIGNTTRRYVTTSSTSSGVRGSTLHVTRADHEADAGAFACVARHTPTGAQTASEDIQLDVQWIGEAKVQLQTPESLEDIKSGDDVTLRCHLDGTGEINIKWFRNGEPVVESDHVSVKKRRFHIKHATPVDNGVYRCVASNEAGEVYSRKADLALIIGTDSDVVITHRPSDIHVRLGGNARFDCKYRNADVVQWYFKHVGPLENTERITVYPNGSLGIIDVQRGDSGVYSCIGMKGESTDVPQTYAAHLVITYIKEMSRENFEPILPESQRRAVAIDKEFQITCLPPAGEPTPKIWWRSPKNHTISDSGPVRVIDGTLIIEKARYNVDTGYYTCVAENSAGATEMSLQLIVTKIPVIIKHPMGVEVNASEPIELSCDFETSEAESTVTKVRWRKNGKVVHDEKGSTGNRVQTFELDGKLKISSAMGSDVGQYVCEVLRSQQPSVISETAIVFIREKLKFSPAPLNKRLELGSTAKIHCKAQGGSTGSPVMRWIKHKAESENKIGNNELLNGELPAHLEDVNGTLLFATVKSEDKGIYSCMAKDGDEAINATIKVDVVVAPKFNVVPQDPTEAVEGYSIMIHCMVEGDPKPTIQWDKNLKMNDFDRSRFEVLENGTLYIKEVHLEDDNNYGCTAGNSAGLNRKEARLLVRSGEGYRANGNGEPENEGAMITKAVLITTSVAAAYIILVVGLMLWCRYRRKSRKEALNAEEGKNGETDTTKEQGDTLKEVVDMTSGPSDQMSAKRPHAQTNGEAHKSDSADTACSENSKRSRSNYDRLQINRENLTDLLQIGRGEFGDIIVGKLKQSANKRNSSVVEDGASDQQTVLIKSLTKSRDEANLEEFKRQIDLFNKTSHENVAKLIGLSREADPHYLILEYTDWGDLKKFLIATNKPSTEQTENPSPPPLTQQQLVSVAYQIALGMEHITDQRLLHKDLATRNCLITSKLGAKISLPALTKDVYREEYCKHVNRIIPLRWLPQEAVFDDDYSTKSDVWSWACLVWELFSHASMPFSDMSDSAVLAQLKNNELEWIPHEETPEPISQLQLRCWSKCPTDRPLFSEVVKVVSEILKNM